MDSRRAHAARIGIFALAAVTFLLAFVVPCITHRRLPAVAGVGATSPTNAVAVSLAPTLKPPLTTPALQLEYDFVVAPGADPDSITLAIVGGEAGRQG